MKYKVWDSVSYGDGDPLVPFTKIYESNELNDVINFADDNEKKYGVIFVTDINNEVLFDTTMKIYESPDGKIIYCRNILSNKREIINNKQTK